MHPLLTTPELVIEIASYLESRDCYRFGASCRSLWNITVSVLWRTLYSETAFRCFSVQPQYDLGSPEWNDVLRRIGPYLPLIRRLMLPYVDRGTLGLLQILQHAQTGQPDELKIRVKALSMAFRSGNISAEVFNRVVDLVVSLQLKELVIRLPGPNTTRAEEPYHQNLVTLLRGFRWSGADELAHFSLSTWSNIRVRPLPEVRATQAEIVGLVYRLPQHSLRILDLHIPLDVRRLMPVLASFPRLEDLCLEPFTPVDEREVAPILGDIDAYPDRPFPSLQRLSLGTTGDVNGPLLCKTAIPKISSDKLAWLTLCTRDADDFSWASSLLKLHGRNLLGLELALSHGYGGLAYIRSEMDMCPNLQHFRLHLVGEDLNILQEEELEQAAYTWPDLRTLDIRRHARYPGRPILPRPLECHVLTSLSVGLKHLQSLRLPVVFTNEDDLRLHLETLEYESRHGRRRTWQPCALQEFDITECFLDFDGGDPVGAPASKVASTLRIAFPNIRTIRCDPHTANTYYVKPIQEALDSNPVAATQVPESIALVRRYFTNPRPSRVL
ncbi:hypothetical protein CALVIDRAFT_102565 [Calocera viscosa TUFC12733]|uniref:F-box domain-containing protein n=1 Tax=Calocera viscosa (strain TUFC12733) TaxID=1330018 RepID=A0A167MMC3_CALVF|nr:hypothetical protein CALVIDRAFT_102565 [Calocera viscosa TUFC12733]